MDPLIVRQCRAIQDEAAEYARWAADDPGAGLVKEHPGTRLQHQFTAARSATVARLMLIYLIHEPKESSWPPRR